TRPIAQAYAGHQFGGFTMLGDGRAILLGEHRTPSGSVVDIQLKGSGRTRFSRGGDGLAALGPMLREYIISEAMAALRIPTTRSLAVVTTGEPVYRESIRRGAILTRVASSHLRVGTFEYAARLGQDAVRQLVDYAVARHDPQIIDSPAKPLDFLRAVADRQASLIARWQLVGFIHGVMNTDNMALSGETIDYGPCAFMNVYHPGTVFSSIDRGGRYAYGNQAQIAQWNLARFAETLLPLFDPDPDQAISIAMEVLNDFPRRFESYWLAGMRKKLGLPGEDALDLELIQTLLDWMEQRRADFTNTFRSLSEARPPEAACDQDPQFREWHSRWMGRLGPGDHSDLFALMRSVNPAVIPRNHRVEDALRAAEDEDDFAPLDRLLRALAAPFEIRDEFAEYRDPPEDEAGYRTFCGT
ncbi:MAG TPA: YdiU family protein, partial [Nitrospiraceae bacterium]|nr:YdiU family protein [Nitrospiraceae bacterium]